MKDVSLDIEKKYKTQEKIFDIDLHFIKKSKIIF